MSSGYAYACERAELLGLPVPTEEEWAKAKAEEEEREGDNRDEEDDEALRNLEHDDDTAKRVSGGLDELNSILSVTQKKINRFKTVCGSLGGLLKVRVGSRPNTPNREVSESSRTEDDESQPESTGNEENAAEITENLETERNAATKSSTKKIDLNEKMGSHLDKLDSLITKAENAQYSMKHQNKQMRKFLN